jgi:hypothetical protein
MRCQVHEERPLNTGHGSRPRSATAGAQRPPAGQVELGEFGVDVDDAEEVEVLRVGREMRARI